MDEQYTLPSFDGDPYLRMNTWSRVLEQHLDDTAAVVAAVKRHFGEGIVPSRHPTEAAIEAVELSR